METMTVLGSDVMGFGISADDAKALGKKLAESGPAPGVLAEVLRSYDVATRTEIIAAYQSAGGDLDVMIRAQFYLTPVLRARTTATSATTPSAGRLAGSSSGRSSSR